MAYQLNDNQQRKIKLWQMENNTEEKVEQAAVPEEKKKSLNPKVFLIGLPLFIVQLLIVYFITANILLNKMGNAAGLNPEEEIASVNEATDSSENGEENIETGKFIFPIEDIIVNPAGTNGQRLALVSIGLDVGSEEEMTALETKNVMLKDMIISLFSSKSLTELSQPESKETLKTELAEKLKEILPDVNVNSVYFSKYILQ